MSILIKGMEMPQNCSACLACKAQLVRDDDEIVSGVAYVCAITCKTTDVGKLEDCPLVPVPPHGRLIDADALRQSIKESIDECHKWAEEVNEGEMYARVSQALGTFVECSLRVKAAPTIIPAEEGE